MMSVVGDLHICQTASCGGKKMARVAGKAASMPLVMQLGTKIRTLLYKR